ncbi:MAG: secretin N-terminal domain-containing protein, partial [Planctomycetota bacterium]
MTQPVEGEAPVNGQIRFGFAEAPFAQVLDFFSRETGLPVIREADVPGGAMSFVSERVYSLNEALEILNLNLARHGVRVVREQSFLYLRSLADAARKPTEVASPADLDGVAPTEYVTVTIELNNSAASRVAEQVRTLIKEPGSVQAVDAQNLIILVETAAQARRISELVARIDSQRPVDSEYK